MTPESPDHSLWADSVGAYLLGALPADEHAGFEAHLEACEHCRRDTEHLRVAAEALPVGVPLVAPPPELKDRIMAVARAEAELLSAAGSRADAPAPAARPARARRSFFAGLLARPALAGVCALLLLVAGAAGGTLLRGGEEEARVVAAQTTARGADVRLQVRDEGSTLLVRNMPPPPDGRLYQVWLKRPNADPVPTDVMWGVREDGSAEVAVPGSLEDVEAVLVTDEPQGGATVPSRAPVITASPA